MNILNEARPKKDDNVEVFINPITREQFKTKKQQELDILNNYVYKQQFEYPLTSKALLNKYLDEMKRGNLLTTKLKNKIPDENYIKNIATHLNISLIERDISKIIKLKSSIQSSIKYNPTLALNDIQQSYKTLDRGISIGGFSRLIDIKNFYLDNAYGSLYYLALDIIYDILNQLNEEERNKFCSSFPAENINNIINLSIHIDMVVNSLIKSIQSFYDVYADVFSEMKDLINTVFNLDGKLFNRSFNLKHRSSQTKSIVNVQIHGINNKFPKVFQLVDSIGNQWKLYLYNLSSFLRTIENSDINLQHLLRKYIELLNNYIKINNEIQNVSVQNGVNIIEKSYKIINQFYTSLNINDLYSKMIINQNKADVMNLAGYTLKILNSIERDVQKLKKLLGTYNSFMKK